MQQYALIVAGGIGKRMQSELPKQFLELKGKPILMHTIEAFFSAGCDIIVVLPNTQLDVWESLCSKHNFLVPHHKTIGGETRFQSVKNGLALVLVQDSLVAIHDGVRPIISQHIIATSFAVAKQKGNAISAVKLKDSIRVINKDSSQTVLRDDYRLIQTPQTFRTALLQEAYKQADDIHFTDDASVLEKMGEKINLIEGDYRNIKITTPEDLLFAEQLLT